MGKRVTRVGLDSHIGHASPTPNPFHRTSYASGSPDVFANGAAVVRVGDTTGCGDPATGGSSTVKVNGKVFIEEVMELVDMVVGCLMHHQVEVQMFLLGDRRI